MRSKPPLRETQGLRRALGGVGFLLYSAHAAYHVLSGHPEHALWACHLGTLAVGVGLIARWPEGVAVGFLWLSVGMPMWVYDFFARGVFLPTSSLTHVGGFILGLFGVRVVGLPQGAWWRAGAGLVILHLLSRWITPEPSNVNMAFSVWPGWEKTFPSHAVYVMLLFVVCLGIFAGAEVALRGLGIRGTRHRIPGDEVSSGRTMRETPPKRK